jgi:hypothetical protein
VPLPGARAGRPKLARSGARPYGREVRRLAISVLVVAACAPRATPYRFGGPVVGGPRLPPPVWAARPTGEGPGAYRPDVPLHPRRAPTRTAIRTAPRAASRPAEPTRLAPPPAPPDLASLPAPHREPHPRPGTAAIDLGGIRETADLRRLVGGRDGRDPLAFALDVRARLLGDRWSAADGPALVAAARTRGRLAAPGVPIRPGALLVFDRAVRRQPASLVAVAIDTDDRGVTEMVFLGAGVVRRGWVCPAHPHAKRDRAGRIENTFLRHRNEIPPPGTHFLAGELLAHVIGPR